MMESEPKKYEYTGQQSFTSGYTDADSLRVRMDSSPLIQQIYTFLTGSMIVEETVDGAQTAVHKRLSEPLCSVEGANSICNFILMMCNAQVFQGKIDREMFDDEIQTLHEHLAVHIMTIRPEINLSTANYHHVVTTIISFLKTQLSGVIEGFRTTSLNAAHKTVEQTRIKDKGGLFNK